MRNNGMAHGIVQQRQFEPCVPMFGDQLLFAPVAAFVVDVRVGQDEPYDLFVIAAAPRLRDEDAALAERTEPLFVEVVRESANPPRPRGSPQAASQTPPSMSLSTMEKALATMSLDSNGRSA